jgi:hypothetical protein
LQGIPVLHGLFAASGFVYMLKMSDCGKSLADSQIKDRQLEIIDAYEKPHQTGIFHIDVA